MNEIKMVDSEGNSREERGDKPPSYAVRATALNMAINFYQHEELNEGVEEIIELAKKFNNYLERTEEDESCD